MTKPEFDAAVDALLVQYGGSVTSGRRTAKHSIQEGGWDGDPHTQGFGVDVVWDETPSPITLATVDAARLWVLHEKDHDHLQPADWHTNLAAYGGKPKP